MSEPILPLRQWPSGIQQASVPANDNALRVEALSRPVLGVADDAAGGDLDGDVWLVGDTPTGDFSTFDENDIALYHVDPVSSVGGWHAWAPVDGLRLLVDDVPMIYVGGSTSAWEEYTSGGIPDAPSDGSTYGRKDGGWEVVAGGGGMTNPMTTAGDIIYGGSSGTPTRLGVGTNGHVLTLASGVPTWAASGGGGGSDVVNVITPTNSSGTVTLDFASKSKYIGAITLGGERDHAGLL